jgi:spheroidene monooxygenase
MPKIHGLRFYKLFGTGSGHGFTNVLNPFTNTGVYAILAVWPNQQAAKDSINNATIYNKYKNNSEQNWTIFLKPISVRGLWSGKAPFKIEHEAFFEEQQVVALTRATIKLSNLLKFWKRVPDIENVIGSDKNVIFKIGMGEIPWFHQVTFSIWPNANSMNTFARENGPHAAAIEAVRKENWFAEELYARFQIIDQIGSWQGVTYLHTPSTKTEVP